MGLIARELEGRGIPTVVITMSREMTERFSVPRAIYFAFPLGHPLGRPFDVAMQRQVLFEALETLEATRAPGEIRIGSLEFQGEACAVCVPHLPEGDRGGRGIG